MSQHRAAALLATRACWWAINELRSEHASIRGLARQLATTWNTVWSSSAARHSLAGPASEKLPESHPGAIG
jgi:hypothetical protein